MGTPIWKGPTDVLYEQPGSPKLEVAEKITLTQTYKGWYPLCLSSALPRGAFGSGLTAGFRIGTCRVDKERGGIGVLTFIWEAIGPSGAFATALPPDEYSIEPFDINPRLETHKIFANMSEEDKSRVRTAYAAPSIAEREQAIEFLDDPFLGNVLLGKLSAGIEAFYLTGFTYSWTLYFWTAPFVTSGGYIQTPGGPLASILAATDVPLTFLRFSDTLTFTGQYYRLTRKWTGAPATSPKTYWDTDLYT